MKPHQVKAMLRRRADELKKCNLSEAEAMAQAKNELSPETIAELARHAAALDTESEAENVPGESND